MIDGIFKPPVATFKSQKPAILVGEQVLREFKKEFPLLVSPALLAVRVQNCEGLKSNHNLKDKLAMNISAKSKDLQKLRDRLDYHSYDACLTTIKKEAKRNNLANCGEISRICQDKLLSKGIMAKRVTLYVDSDVEYISKRKITNHAFVVINLPKNAVQDRPEYWGNNAVIVDAWANVCGSAKDVIEYYKTILKLDKNNEWLRFAATDKFDVEEVFKNKSKGLFGRILSLFSKV